MQTITRRLRCSRSAARERAESSAIRQWAGSCFLCAVLFARVAQAQTITLFPSPTDGSLGHITAGPDGALWFTKGSNKIGRVTTNGIFSEFPVPTPSAFPFGITAASDGNLWFTENGGLVGGIAKVARITRTGTVTEFSLPDPNSRPGEITAGADGALWFTELGKIGRLTIGGSLTEFPLATLGSPSAITAGPDGNVWFGETSGRIGRITPSGDITEFLIPTPNTFPTGITAGPDGALWFIEYAASKIGRVTTTGLFSEFQTASFSEFGIITGPDGNLWFGTDNNLVGRMTPTGTVSTFYVEGSNRYLVVGSDMNIWFTNVLFPPDHVGRINIAGSPPIPTIPALSRRGLICLGVLLAAVSSWILRSR